MGLKINISPAPELNQSTEVSQSDSSVKSLPSNTDAQNEEAIQFLNNRTSATRISASRDETKKELTTADFLREVLKQQPVAINDENAAKVQLTMKVSKSPQSATRDDYNLAFRRAVYEKAMDGLKLTDKEIKLADEALINAGLYKTYYNLQGNIENLKSNQEKSGSSMPISVGKENIEYARRAGQAVLQFREYESLTADAKAEYARRYATDALGGFVQVPINGGVNIVNGLSEPFRAGERLIFGTNYIPEVPRMTVAEQSEYWNKDGRMYANKGGEIAATIAFGGVAGSKMLASQTGRVLIGAESGYNAAAAYTGVDVTQIDENGNARQMEWLERGLRFTGGVFGARQTIKTEISTPNSAVNKLNNIFKDPPTFKPQTEFVTNEGIIVKVNENTFEKPLQSADDLILEARKKINSDYAGKDFPLEEYCEQMAAKNPSKAEFYNEVAEKYPNGVKFTSDGFPDFSPYAIKTVKPKGLTGKDSDFTLANKAAGFKETPAGYTWHHHQDLKTMQLVPFDLHYTVKHTGGASKLKNPNAW